MMRYKSIVLGLLFLLPVQCLQAMRDVAAIHISPAVLAAEDKRLAQQMLFQASSCGDIDLIDHALRMGAEINGRHIIDPLKPTALMYACYNNKIDAAHHLLRRGADRYMRAANGQIAEDFLRPYAACDDSCPAYYQAPKERVRLTAKERAFKKRLKRMNHNRNRQRR